MIDKRFSVRAGEQPAYDIIIKDHFYGLTEEMSRLDCGHRRVCIVADDQVASLWLEEVYEILAAVCGQVKAFVFSAGEGSKNLATVSRLYEFLIRNGFDRKDLLVALGGGVAGDMTGFTAATYLRGIGYIQVPTSLLSQIDSSIGGKTGVDLLHYKNMVGAFYMPELVYINIETLRTLPDRQYVSGLGEVIKHGLIRDRAYYDRILSDRVRIRDRDPAVMADIVEGSILVKRAVVEEDPKEKGIRAILNYGHTIGHAVEKLTDFSLTHGECVGIGSVAAASISADKGLLDRDEAESIRDLYAWFGFPAFPEGIDPEELVLETRHDKKMAGGKLRFILLSSIGQAVIRDDVTDRDIIDALSHLRERDA